MEDQILGIEMKILTGQDWLNAWREIRSLNKSWKTKCLAMMKYRQVKVDRMFGMKKEVQIGQKDRMFDNSEVLIGQG